ncbi:hypothetical protein J6590_057854 [Homalodisca vitripennis]|nr:hypothetical protein J6590_057854 [Homalodisca vitripennis]
MNVVIFNIGGGRAPGSQLHRHGTAAGSGGGGGGTAPGSGPASYIVTARQLGAVGVVVAVGVRRGGSGVAHRETWQHRLAEAVLNATTTGTSSQPLPLPS